MKIAIFIFHLLTSVIMTLFEIYFIYNIFAKYMNIIKSPYIIGLALGVLVLLVTYLIWLKGTSTLVSFLPSIGGTILLIIIGIFYIWKTQYFDGSGYFFVCVFLAPYVALSALWSLFGWLFIKMSEEKHNSQYQTTTSAQAE